MDTTSSDRRQEGRAHRVRGVLVTCAWIVAALALLFVLVMMAARLRDTTSGGDISAALARGERPQAPALPDRVLGTASGAQNPADGLPDSDWTLAGPGGEEGIFVVNFWASWCGPCRDEAPVLAALHERYADRGVRVIGVNAQDVRTDARGFLEEFSIPYANVRATRTDEERWGVGGFPETYIVTGSGEIAGRIAGPVDEGDLVATVEELVEERDAGTGR